MRREDHCDDYYDLCLLLNLTDLLATCCQGELLQTEQIASKLFPLEEIIGYMSIKILSLNPLFNIFHAGFCLIQIYH